MIGIHMLHSMANRSPSPSGRQRGRPSQPPSIVRVQARTALPIVGSVPKCQPAGEQSARSGRRATGRSLEDKCRRAGRLEADERVLLIVNDDPVRGGGVPVIGRRLPSKSMSLYQQMELPSELDYSQPPSIQVDQNQSSLRPEAPVIGRRSHRMLMEQQQQQQRHKSIFYYDNQPANLVELAKSRPEAQQVQTRQTNGTTTANQKQHKSARQLQRRAEQHQNSSSRLDDDFIQPTEKQSKRLAANKRSSRSMASIPATNSNITQPCCSLDEPPANCLACATCSVSSIPQLADCMEPCCQYRHPLQLQPPTGAGYSAKELARSASCQRLPIANSASVPPMRPMDAVLPVDCCLPIVDRSTCQQAHRRSHHHHHHQHYLQQQHHHQHNHSHRTCRANEPTVSQHRSSSCSDHSGRNHRIQPNGPNKLPVQPKPTLDYNARILMADYISNGQVGNHQYSSLASTGLQADSVVMSEEAAAVSQMYESLAAELKAKLASNSKTAPILLPPKDYDTLSRKQGKLSGIEQRRSTNPMLIGPAANRLLQTACDNDKQTSRANEEQLGHQMDVRSNASSMSRHDQQSLECGRDSQRSMSNSSSGLGSISMGPGSPSNISPSSSSPSASSDDMRHSSSHHSVFSSDESPVSNLKMADQIAANKCRVGSDRGNTSDSGQSSNGRLATSYDSSSSAIDHLSTNNRTVANQESHNSAINSRLSESYGSSNSSMADPQPTAMFDSRHDKRQMQSTKTKRGQGIQNHNPSRVSDGVLWNGRVEVPLKVNSEKNGNTYLATKQIIY